MTMLDTENTGLFLSIANDNLIDPMLLLDTLIADKAAYDTLQNVKGDNASFSNHLQNFIENNF